MATKLFLSGYFNFRIIDSENQDNGNLLTKRRAFRRNITVTPSSGSHDVDTWIVKQFVYFVVLIER